MNIERSTSNIELENLLSFRLPQSHDSFAESEQTDLPGRLGNCDRQRAGVRADAGRRDMSGTESRGKAGDRRFALQVRTGGHNDAVTPHNQRTIDMGKLLDGFSQTGIHDVALVLLVSAKWIHDQLLGLRHNRRMVAHHKQRADRFAFPSFPRQIRGDL